MLDLRLLRFFIAIYEEKNITAAAERCHVSQPSLSAGLRQLEEALGDSLFVRGKKGVVAKDPAHYLYPHAVKLVEEARRLPELFRQKATRARLNIAIMPDLSRRRVAGLLQQVQGVLPQLDLTLSDYTTPADCRLTLDALRREDEIFLPLWEEDYVLCVPVDHPWQVAKGSSCPSCNIMILLSARPAKPISRLSACWPVTGLPSIWWPRPRARGW